MNLTAFAQEKDNPATFKKTSFRKYRSRRFIKLLQTRWRTFAS
jgi:hypothetical protein